MGGNVFKDKTQNINITNIKPTVNEYFKELKRVFPQKNIFNLSKFHYLGSAGKKDVSGDIDFGINTPDIVKDFSDEELKKWELVPEEIKEDFNKMKKRARTATDDEIMMKAVLKGIANKLNQSAPNIFTDPKKVGPGSMFGLFPQFTPNKQDYGVQMDWMVGDIDLLKFSYYSESYKGNIKGLHRTQLMLAMFQGIDYSFSHTKGLTDKTSGLLITTKPSKMIQILNDKYNLNMSRDDINNYFTLFENVQKLSHKEYNRVIDTYLSILDKTRTDIPENLQQEYIQKQKQLNLQGKFLPLNSKLKGKICQE